MHWPNTCEFHNSVPALLCPFLGWVAYFLRDISVYLKCAPPTILDVYKGYVLLKISWLIDPISTQSITFGERETVFRLISARKEETCTWPQFFTQQVNLLRAATVSGSIKFYSMESRGYSASCTFSSIFP